jgi:hypothetical protein
MAGVSSSITSLSSSLYWGGCSSSSCDENVTKQIVLGFDPPESLWSLAFEDSRPPLSADDPRSSVTLKIQVYCANMDWRQSNATPELHRIHTTPAIDAHLLPESYISPSHIERHIYLHYFAAILHLRHHIK